MKYKMGVKRNGPFCGTCLQGYLNVPYSKIVEVLGEPNGGSDGYKTAFEWELTFENGTVAHIYDYKESNLYDYDNPSPEQMIKEDFSRWHIGGYNEKVVPMVQELFISKDKIKANFELDKELELIENEPGLTHPYKDDFL